MFSVLRTALPTDIHPRPGVRAPLRMVGAPPRARPPQRIALTLPAGATLRILSDGRAGHVAQALGVAEALGVAPDLRRVSPRAFYACLAPFGPIDPSEAAGQPGSPVGGPFPDIAIAAGRRTLPYLRDLKRASGGRCFTVYINAPANGLGAADLIVAPQHDRLTGPNVFSPLTPANGVTQARLENARAEPDPRIAALPGRRVALLVGGDSRHFKYTPADAAALADAARAILASGASVMATVSRRSPQIVTRALAAALDGADGFLWDGAGDNPYFSILANADAFLVTSDSVSMVGEAAATGAPIHVFAPSGGHAKIGVFLEALRAQGAVRPWTGRLEDWRYAPINSTPKIAQAIATAFAGY